MAEHRTIYCKLSKEEVVTVVSKRFSKLVLDGEPHDWSTITAQGDGGTMTLNALVFQYTNDEYSNLHFKTCMAIWDIETLDDDEKERLNEAFGQKKLIVGVVVEPDFATDVRFMETVFEIAKRLDGLILTGDSILDSAGSTLAVFS